MRGPALIGVLLLAMGGPCLAADPRSESLARQLLDSARVKLESGADSEALRDLERLSDLASAPAALVARATLLRAYLHARAARNAEAARLFAQAARSAQLPDSERRQAARYAAGLHLALDQPAEALAQLPVEDRSVEARILRGRAELRLRRFGVAIAHLRQAVAALSGAGEPIDDALYLDLLGAYQQNRDWPAAIETLSVLLERRPDRADWWRLLGDLHLQQGQRKLTAAAWQTALLQQPDRLELRGRLATLYLNLGLPVKALAALDLDEVMKRSGSGEPAPAELLALSAHALEMAREEAQALRRWQDLLDRTARPEYRLSIARLLSQMQRWKEAEAHWRELLAGNPDGLDPADHLQAAISAYRTGQRAVAASRLRPVFDDPELGASARQWHDYIETVSASTDRTDTVKPEAGAADP